MHPKANKTVSNVDIDRNQTYRDPSAAEKASLTFVFNSWGTNISKELDKIL